MSGTSADGLDIAICRISPAPSRGVTSRSSRLQLTVAPPKLKLLAHTHTPYPRALRKAVLAAMAAESTSTAELSRLHWHLGQFYAEAAAHTLAKTKLQPQLVAMHGQTIYHQAVAQPYLGAPTRTTWQIGEPSVLAERLKLPVVSDFRPADLAAGGQGAPLVPMLDYTLFRHATRNRVLLNLGGIANLTATPAGGGIADVRAFDTGPANMVIDTLMTELFHRPYDANGATAARGQVLQPVLKQFLEHPFFAAEPPKSCGREEFGAAFTQRFLAACQKQSPRKQDAIATATALTVQSIFAAYARFVWPHLGQHAPLAQGTDLIVAGGGAHNATLFGSLRDSFAQLGVKVSTTEQHASALPIEAKEAAAFALLGWLTWHRLPGNVPSATGASHPAILGKITLA